METTIAVMEKEKMIREYIASIDDNKGGTSCITEEEVVRCKDCKWCKHYEQDEQDCYFCINAYGMYGDDRAEDDYCSYGERKEQEDE